jgi:hypothetical protein
MGCANFCEGELEEGMLEGRCGRGGGGRGMETSSKDSVRLGELGTLSTGNVLAGKPKVPESVSERETE